MTAMPTLPQVCPKTHKLSFKKISPHSTDFKLVINIFETVLEPLYGYQASAIKKLKESFDRTCEIMYSSENPLGILVYKDRLQSEHGLTNALELKTLLLFEPEKNSNKGFGSYLFSKIDEIALKKGTRTIFCTASSKVQKSINCALKNGFEITRILSEGPGDNNIQYLLVKNI